MQCRRNDWQFDSGQIIIDKVAQSGLNLAALVAASVMQEDHDFWFKISGGVSIRPEKDCINVLEAECRYSRIKIRS